MASCWASGPGSSMQKFSACRNRRSPIQRFSSTRMRCITAICPAGPPKLSAATRAQTRKAAAKLMPWPVGQGPRDSFPRGPLAAEDREQIVEQPGASRQALLLLRRIGADPRDQHLQARRLLAGELAVLEIDVVDDLGDLAETRILEPAPRQQHLEAAA